ncbi:MULTISPECIES: hypothetical protein [unclassified Streptomyces]|uniref:hypothetical protein n=1 Tax=Streptomyces sp. NBC_01707 TaxID=2975914 RepID=UPI002F916238
MAEGSSLTAPTLLYIVGPPAVGKAIVGHEIATRTGLRLFHNHMAIEPVLRSSTSAALRSGASSTGSGRA